MDRRYLFALLLCACSPATPSDDAGPDALSVDAPTADAVLEATAPDVQSEAAPGPEASSGCPTGQTYCPAEAADGGRTAFEAGCSALANEDNCGACGVRCYGIDSCNHGVCCYRGNPGCL